MIERGGGAAGVGEVSEVRGALERERGDTDQRGGADDDHDSAEPGVDALVVDPARGDALVDDVRLLKEQLPRRDGRADHRDDEQHRGGVRAALNPRDEEVPRDIAGVGVGEEEQGDHKQVREHEHEHPSLPGAEAARGSDRDERHCGDRHRDVLGDAEVPEREADPDELGRDREEVQHEQVSDGEPAPEASEALLDQPRVPHAGDRTEPNHHLLVDDQHRNQQEQHPEQAGAVVLPGLRVGRDPAGVVVADHHDQAWADDREQREQPGPEAVMSLLVLADLSECALDVTDVR